jgi:hypothetical protein
MKNKKTVKVNLKKCTKGGKIPHYDMGGDVTKKQFNTNTFGQLGNLAGAATGAINTELDWKQNPNYSVANESLQKGIETGLGSNPVTSTFMNIGKAGEALGDSVAPGLGEGLFAPHKSIMRAFKEGKPQYAIPLVGSMIAAADSQKQLNQETLDKSKMLNPYGDSVLKLGGALIQYDAPSHKNGGQMITPSGATTSNPNKAIAEIEKKETMHNGYVFSDTLKDTNGKTFAAVSKTIENRFKGKNDPISLKTRKLQLELLKEKNETSKDEVEENQSMQMEFGGDPIKKLGDTLGGGITQTDMTNLGSNGSGSPDQGELFNNQMDYVKNKLAQENIDVDMSRKLNRMNFGAYKPTYWKEELHKLDKEGEANKKYYPNIKLKCGGKIKKMDNGGDPTKQEIIPNNEGQIDAGDIWFNNSYLDQSVFNKQSHPLLNNPLVVNDRKYLDTTQIDPITKMPLIQTQGQRLSAGLAGLNSGATVKGTLATNNLATITPGQLKNIGRPMLSTKEIAPKNPFINQQFDMGKATPLTEEDLATMSEKDKAELTSKGMDYLTPARIGKGMELAGKTGILSAGYDKVKVESNPEYRKVAELMKNRINNQAILNQINLQRNAGLASNNDARSLNVKRALDARTYNAAGNAAANAKLQEQMQNNNYKQQEAQVLSQLGSEEARARVYAEDATARNKGQWLTNLGTVLGDVGRAGEFETKVKVNDMQVAESLAMLGMKYTDYGVDAETYKRLKEGKYTIDDVEKLQNGLIKYKGNGK